MTEAEWLTCTVPEDLLRFLGGKVSARKLRLLAVAGCRRVWHLLDDERSQRAVEVAERYADGLASARELRAAECQADAAWGHAMDTCDDDSVNSARSAVFPTCCPDLDIWEVWESATSAAAYELFGDCPEWDEAQRSEFEAMCDVLRDLFGNPFRRVSLSPDWLAWHGRLVPQLAKTIYEEHAFEQMPILGDALEEAGCTDEALLRHCHERGEHVRGCWALDLVLGKA